ncbi:MAG: septal ring lytic transglycosylase RlpA family protein [Terriglobales bacterium]
MRKACCILALGIIFAAAPGARSSTAGIVAQARAKQAPYQIGLASWYGPRFQGRETTSGEIFNMMALTAAHRQLPLGTRVMVTNLCNDRSLVVKINDRGPHVPGRIIDLSMGAAKALGFKAAGLTPVRLDVLSRRHSVN